MRRAVITFILALALTPAAGYARSYCVADLPGFDPPRPARDEGRMSAARFDLKAFGVQAFWQRDVLYFTDQAGVTYPLRRFNSGDDFNGWDGVLALENHWLYVAGAQYRYAVKLSRGRDGRWQAVRAILLQDDGLDIKGWAGDLFDAMTGFTRQQIQRTGTVAKVTYHSAPLASTVLHRLLFRESGYELRDGHLRPAPWRGMRYVGGIDAWGVVLFLSADHRLYSYDGARLRPVAGGDVGPDMRALPANTYRGAFIGHLDTVDTGRSFYRLKTANFEIVRSGDGLILNRLALLPEADMFSTRFVALPGKDMLVLTRAHIYRFGDWTPLYTRAVPAQQIDTTGMDDFPAYDARRGGVVFREAVDWRTSIAQQWRIARPCG